MVAGESLLRVRTPETLRPEIRRFLLLVGDLAGTASVSCKALITFEAFAETNRGEVRPLEVTDVIIVCFCGVTGSAPPIAAELSMTELVTREARLGSGLRRTVGVGLTGDSGMLMTGDGGGAFKNCMVYWGSMSSATVGSAVFVVNGTGEGGGVLRE